MDAQARRKKLIEQILEWNSSRLDLFELSLPNENEEFNGVMRFFYQDEDKRYQTKCIRVSSCATTSEVVEILREKFFPLDTSIPGRRFGIYEHHANGVRRLTNDERPLLVQLNWSKLDREGKFVLKLETASADHFQLVNGSSRKITSNGATVTAGPLHLNTGRLRRRWSVRKDKQQGHDTLTESRSRRSPLGCAAVVQNWTKERLDGHHHHRTNNASEHTLTCLPASGMKLHSPGSQSDAELRRGASAPHTLHSESPPDSTFTRTICNPEALMRRKRQRTLEAKLHQILQHGGPDIGGTLKIYGGQICPEVPYKTLLLSVSDSVADVIRQSLDKYGLEEADPDAYCLVMRIRSASEVAAGLGGVEEVLSDTDCPLGHLFSSSPEAGAVVTFELRHRPPHLLKRRPFSESSSASGTPYWNVPHPPATDPFKPSNLTSRPNNDLDAVFACLVEVDGNDANLCTGTVFPLPIHKGQVCVGTALNSNATYPHIVTLPLTLWPDVELRHLIIWRPPLPPGITASMAAADATTKRGGWLACRPCMRPGTSSGQPQFATVFVNGQPLRQTAENRHCVHWLAPGDILRLGHGPRALRIWPGDGSALNAPQRLFPKFHPHLVEPSSPTVSTIGCPEVPKHQRLYASNVSRLNRPLVGGRTRETGQTPVHFSPELTRPSDTAASRAPLPVSYLSPLVQRVSPQSADFAHVDLSAYRDPAGDFILSPFQSTSASSSSLSSAPVTDIVVGEGTDGSSFAGFTQKHYAPHQHPYHPHSLHDERAAHSLLPQSSISSASPPVSVASVSHDLSGHRGDSLSAAQQILYVTPSCRPIAETPIDAISPEPLNPSLRTQEFPEEPSEHTLVDGKRAQLPSLQLPSSAGQSRSTRSNQPSVSKPSRSKSSTISDRLPCQMAFAPGSIGQLLDWVIPRHLRMVGSPDVLSSPCPLGPAISVYLMLRAICRQCDRWEMIEARQNLKESIDKARSPNLSLAISASDVLLGPDEAVPTKSNLLIHQRRRRQRELLSLLVNAVERLQTFETVLIDWIRPLGLLPNPSTSSNCSTTDDELDAESCTDPVVIRGVFRSLAAWLANASQLLHLITRDVDLSRAFEADLSTTGADNESALGSMTRSAWTLVQEQLTDVVQAAFGLLSDLVVTRLDRVAIPNLLNELERWVAQGDTDQCPNAKVESVDEARTKTDVEPPQDPDTDLFRVNMPLEFDVTLNLFNETLDCMHAAYVNPAFTVQLFARLLHRLNARLFNFLLGHPSEEDVVVENKGSMVNCGAAVDVHRTHVSPAWGRVLHRWIHAGLCAWAVAQGLGTAAECYLQRVSQAAELMLADVSSVESLYNVTVDLVGLNSRQVRHLLESFVQSANPVVSDSNSNADQDQLGGRIPDAWIEFVVSGVKLVADRILADEVEESPVNGSTEPSVVPKVWEPRLTEPLDLQLPLLLPEDSYPSDNPVPVELNTDEPTSLDSGISSRPSSAKGPSYAGVVTDNQEPVDALITVDSVRQFLTPAIESGWCRLSVRPICSRTDPGATNATISNPGRDSTSDETSTAASTSNLISWSVYLGDTGVSRVPNSPAASQATTIQSDIVFQVSESTKLDQFDPMRTTVQSKSDQRGGTTVHNPVDSQPNNCSESACPRVSSPADKNGSQGIASNSSMDRSFTVDCIDRLVWCSRHRPLTVVVPKIGSSLGLSIVAARSEDGRDMGIYVRGVVPESGASQARLLHPTSLDDSGRPLLQPGDHLLAVNDQPVTGLAQEAAAQLVASCTGEVRLTVVRNPDIRTALHDLNAAKAFRLANANESEVDPGCVECQLRASFHLNPVTLVVDESFPNAPRKPVRTQPPPPPPVGVVLRPTLPDRDPPPAPSALGPVMHLSSTRQSNNCHSGSNRSSGLDHPRAFRSRTVCSNASGSSVSVTYKPAFPQRPSATEANSLSSKDFAGPRVHPLKGYTSCSMNALHRATGSNPARSTERILFPSHTLGRVPPLIDLDDIASSEYSLGVGPSAVESTFTPSLSSDCTGRPPIGGDHAHTIPVPCHRPKGQSASFDDWISASRIRDLCEKWSEGLPYPLEKTEQPGHEQSLASPTAPSTAALIHPRSSLPRLQQNSASSQCCERANKQSDGTLAPHWHEHAYSEASDNQQTSVGTSKPPTTFVPTALVLPCSGNRFGLTNGCDTSLGDYWNLGSMSTVATVPWTSRSLGDLASLTESRGTVADCTGVGANNRRGRSARGLQRRHTTVTTSRFNLGPRPEPPNQMSSSHQPLDSVSPGGA